MKLLVYECKKILNLKLILFLIIFTFLFYKLFSNTLMHPDDSASCVADNNLVEILQTEYGYDTILPYEDFYILEEIRLKQIEKLDHLVLQSNILQEEGITSWKQLRNMDDYSQEIMDVYSEISFHLGQREVFLVQCIERFYETMEYNPIMGIEDGKEIEAAKIFHQHHTSIGENAGEEVFLAIAEYMKKDQLSLMPDSAMFHVSYDLPLIGILMIISCMVVVLPYQIRERLARVTSLHQTTQTGRNLWQYQYAAVLVSCTIICIVQSIVFGFVLHLSKILPYANFPISGNGHDYFWLDITFGTYCIFNGILYTIIALCTATIFFLISRIASNYIVGIALSIPVAILLGGLTKIGTQYFLRIITGFGDLLRVFGCVFILLGVSLIICFTLNYREKRRDILL